MILNAAVTFSLMAPPPTSQEIGREGAVQLDDVHRRHGEAGAVDHAADIAVELDVGEVVLRRLELHRVLLALVAQRFEIGVAELGVGIEADLGVEHEQLAVVGDRERVDLDLRGVGAEEGVVEQLRDLLRLLGEIAGRGRARRRRRGRDAA